MRFVQMCEDPDTPQSTNDHQRQTVDEEKNLRNKIQQQQNPNQ